MIAYFPTPYPDEIFYSLIARYCIHMSAKGPKDLLTELFGTSNVSATLDFPSHLASFHSRTSSVFDKPINHIIKDHTLLPLYERFISERNLEKIKASMAGRSGDIHTRIGVNAGIHSSLYVPRYCPICFETDKSTYGEGYWHRSHQISTINHCHLHHCQLFEANAERITFNKHFFIPANDKYCSNRLIKLNKNTQINILISKAITLLYNESRAEIAPCYYREALLKVGFAKGTVVNQNSLVESFTSFYSKQTLTYFKSDIAYGSSNCWLKAISRKLRKSVDPIRHILLEGFLENCLVYSSPDYFGSGPWVCLNPVCSAYNRAVITQISVRYDRKSKRKIGQLECRCGFIYTQSFIEKRNKIFRRVLSYGSIWENKLQQLTKENISIRKMASILDCDSKTIKQQLKKIQGSLTSEKTPFLIRQKIKRTEWLALVNQGADKSITHLKALFPTLFTWLYRYDKEWLYTINYKKCGAKDKKDRVCWEERDQQYLRKLEVSYQRIINDKKLRRVSKTLLIKLSCTRSALEKYAVKLPLSTSFIYSVVESKESYRIRKLHFYKNALIDAGEKVEKWKLLRLSGIRKAYLNQRTQHELSVILSNVYP
jgi:hypothetical protein